MVLTLLPQYWRLCQGRNSNLEIAAKPIDSFTAEIDELMGNHDGTRAVRVFKVSVHILYSVDSCQRRARRVTEVFTPFTDTPLSWTR